MSEIVQFPPVRDGHPSLYDTLPADSEPAVHRKEVAITDDVNNTERLALVKHCALDLAEAAACGTSYERLTERLDRVKHHINKLFGR